MKKHTSGIHRTDRNRKPALYTVGRREGTESSAVEIDRYWREEVLGTLAAEECTPPCSR